MKLSAKLFLVAFLAFSMFSCQPTPKDSRKGILYTSGGKTSEILIVMNNELWKSSVGDTIVAVFQDIKPWFAQQEPSYDIMHIPFPAFQNMYPKYRNIILVKIDSEYSENQFKARKNVNSKPQIIVEFNCKTKQDFFEMLKNKHEGISNIFHKNELYRIKTAYKGLNIDSISRKVHQKFGFNMVFPRGFSLAEDKADFVWIRKVLPEIEEGIIIYARPYSDTMDFNYKNIIKYRNQITEKYIPGPLTGSYMKVSSVFPPYYESTEFHGYYATLLRSWWDVEGYPMGGPFLSYTFVDTVANRLITIDGYIKAFKKNKRDLLLHVESIMDSFIMDDIKE